MRLLAWRNVQATPGGHLRAVRSSTGFPEEAVALLSSHKVGMSSRLATVQFKVLQSHQWQGLCFDEVCLGRLPIPESSLLATNMSLIRCIKMGQSNNP